MNHDWKSTGLSEGFWLCAWLTDTDGGEESGGDVRRQAVLEGWLQDVIGEGESNDSQRGWIHDEDSTP